MQMTEGDVVIGRRRMSGGTLFALELAAERRKLHWRERIALWLGKHVRRWEAIHTQN